jgi:predicted alpha/beta-hydrolase family hydrolase
MRPNGLVLFHGAGGDRDHRLFLQLDERLDLPVARCNFPYRDKGPGRRPPDRMPKLLDSIRARSEEFAQLWDVEPSTLLFGGRSMGGRAASMAVAEGMPAAGLLLLSYPLHPPGKPEKLRVEHFGDMTVPVLLIQGHSDPFGKQAEFDEQTGAIAGPLTQVWLDKTGHDPKEGHDATIVGAVSTWITQLG